MAEHASNEFLRTSRAQEDKNDLFAAIGKQVLGLKLDGAEEDDVPEDDRVKIVDEIESLCMNCHENVTRSVNHDQQHAECTPGQHQIVTYQDTLFSRDHLNELLLQSLWLQE